MDLARLLAAVRDTVQRHVDDYRDLAAILRHERTRRELPGMTNDDIDQLPEPQRRRGADAIGTRTSPRHDA